MQIKRRIGLLAAGGLSIAYGVYGLHRYGEFPYMNRYRTTTFPMAVIVTGVVFVALAFLPRAQWVYRFISTKPRREGRLFRALDAQRHHRPAPIRREQSNLAAVLILSH
jgi:hypothetical protein